MIGEIYVTFSFLRDMFKDKEYFKTLLAIALPIVLQNLIASSLNMLDTLMVGMLGEAEIASVGIGNQVFLLFNVMILGLSGGCGIFISQYWGQKDVKNIRRVMGVCLMSGAIISMAFTAAILMFSTEIVSIFNIDPRVIAGGSIYLKTVSISYIFTAITFCIANASRSIEKALAPMVVSSLALVCNATINYILIFGKLGFPAMGVKGAAIGTVIARVFEATLLTAYVVRNNKVLLGSLRGLTDFSLDFVKKIYKIVSHVILNDMFWALGIIIYSVVYGRMGTQELAATQIYNTILNFFTVMILGTASTAVVMVGKQVGMGDKKKAKRYGYQFVTLAVIGGLVLSVLIALSAEWIVKIFDVSSQVKYYTEMILYVISVVLTIRCVNIMMIIGVLRGGGDAKYSLFVDMFAMYGVGIPLAVFSAFVLKFEVYWVVLMIASEEFVKFFLVLKRLRTDKWMKNVSE